MQFRISNTKSYFYFLRMVNDFISYYAMTKQRPTHVVDSNYMNLNLFLIHNNNYKKV